MDSLIDIDELLLNSNYNQTPNRESRKRNLDCLNKDFKDYDNSIHLGENDSL